ncbi:NepR family anti-sigma factor [Sphingosinithalassobacter portus]|uniref:NepR family anti-sigma factor n=1 Tax=Stakelama portus TaxID=2676234 RepID=UPI0012B5B368|nr:NepR family anti-sigma factor [Sphingosinithalassobacter portus]
MHSADQKKTKDQHPPSGNGKDGKRRSDRDVGDALRKAYDDAMGEAIPDSMLDLLKKLS